MSVEVQRITDEELQINGKKIYKDQNDKWIGQNLNNIESKAAHEYIASLEMFIENKKK